MNWTNKLTRERKKKKIHIRTTFDVTFQSWALFPTQALLGDLLGRNAKIRRSRHSRKKKKTQPTLWELLCSFCCFPIYLVTSFENENMLSALYRPAVDVITILSTALITRNQFGNCGPFNCQFFLLFTLVLPRPIATRLARHLAMHFHRHFLSLFNTWVLFPWSKSGAAPPEMATLLQF